MKESDRVIWAVSAAGDIEGFFSAAEDDQREEVKEWSSGSGQSMERTYVGTLGVVDVVCAFRRGAPVLEGAEERAAFLARAAAYVAELEDA